MTLKPALRDVDVLENLDINKTVENRIHLVDALVYHITGANPTVDTDALKSAGYKALYEAVKTYNPEKGSLYRHIAKRVKWAIYDALRAENWIVKQSEEKYQRIPLEKANLCHTNTPYKELEKKEFLELLPKAMKQLSKQERAVIRKHYFLKMTLKEIALKQNIHPRKISRIHCAAKKKLTEILQR